MINDTEHIVLVDDDILTLSTLQKILKKEGIDTISFSKAKEALNYLKENPTPVVLTDLNMPEIDGHELVKEINALQPNTTIIVLSAESDIDIVTDLMRKGAFDYLTKPVNPKELISRVKKAFAFSKIKKVEGLVNKEKESRTKNQLNWNLWKETVMRNSMDKKDGNLIGTLNSGLIQGAGLGSITTLATLIQATAVDEGEYYKVEKGIMDLLFKSADTTSRMIEMLAEIDTIIHNEMELKPVGLLDFQKLLIIQAENLRSYADFKYQEIIIAENKGFSNSKKINWNEEFFLKSTRELFINAMKYSVPETKIYVIFEIKEDFFVVNFLNTPDKQHSQNEGISEDYQALVFEPFIRISKITQDNYRSLDLGLGLSMVEKVVNKHHGKIRAFNLKNFLERKNTILVSLTLEIPLE
jgi:FixJ family two-component response regulator